MGILDGRVVVVAGSDRAVERACARQGASVRSSGSADVADSAVAEAFVRRVVEEFGAIDALVNVCDVRRDRTVVAMSDDDWDDVARAHLRGHLAPTRAACRYWREARRPGRIVHATSLAGLLGSFGQANLAAATAGVAAFSTVVAMEEARHGTTSNAVARSDEAAPLIAFLCSPGAGHVSGKVFGVRDGRVRLYRPFTPAADIAVGGDVDELFLASGMQAGPENRMPRYGSQET
jgi:hypothetical protein